jgi:hypothetical protein
MYSSKTPRHVSISSAVVVCAEIAGPPPPEVPDAPISHDARWRCRTGGRSYSPAFRLFRGGAGIHPTLLVSESPTLAGGTAPRGRRWWPETPASRRLRGEKRE